MMPGFNGFETPERIRKISLPQPDHCTIRPEARILPGRRGASFLLGLVSLFVGKSALTNVFPITAGYTLVDYAAGLETASPIVSVAVYAVLMLILAVCIHYLPSYDDLNA